MKKSIFALGFLAATVVYADETTYVNYGQNATSPQFNLIWKYQTEISGGVTYAVITGVRDSGSDYPSGKIEVPVSVSANPSGPSFIVKKIADGAFANQIGITSISIPNTVENVGAGMFTGCSVLSEISVDEDNPWLAALDGALYDKELRNIYACPALKGAILLPGTLTNIGTEAFAGCHQLVSLDIPASVTSIGSRAFLGCKKLSSITFQGNAPTAPADIVTGDVVTPLNIYKDENSTGWDVSPWNDASIFTMKNGQSQSSGILTETAEYVVWHYRVINGTAEIYFNGSAAIPKSTTQTYHLENGLLVGDGTLNVPSTLGGYPVTGIGDGAFKDCASLKSITLPESIREVGVQPIAGTAVVSLDFPDSLRELKGNPLAGCDTILSVFIAADNSYYTVIDNIIYDKDLQTLVGCPARKESASIASTVTKIGTEAFDGCFRLRELQLPQVLTDIGERAFRGAIRLTTLNIPTFVANIGSKAFADCEALTEVTYDGNAPTAPDDIYDNTPATLTSYAKHNATGFTTGTWKNRPISIVKVPDAMNQVHDDGTVNWTYNVIDGKAIITGADGNVDDKVVTIPGSLDGFTISALNPTALDALSGVKAYESSSSLFVAKNGCLYSADGKTLIRVPNGITLPYSATTDKSTERMTVTTIPGLLESGNPGNDGTSVRTNKVVISSSTKTAAVGGDISFNTILAGVTNIVDHAFYGCNTSLADERDDSSTKIGGETGFIGASGNPYVETVTLESHTITTYKTVVELPATVTSISGNAFEGSAVEVSRSGGSQSAMAVAGSASDGKVGGAAELEADTSYIGWIEDGGRVTGTLTIKTGKKTKGVLKISGTAVRIGSKKKAIKIYHLRKKLKSQNQNTERQNIL